MRKDGYSANEALVEFQRDREKEGSHVAFMITLGMNGMLHAWLASGLSDACYAEMCDDIAKWASKEALLRRPAGSA